MRLRACFPVVVGVLLSIASGPAWAGGTSLVYSYGGSFALRIPADPAANRGWMQDAVLMVPDHILICDVDVQVGIRHTSAFDLQLYLEGPRGDVVALSLSDLFEGFYKGADYDSTTFDDEAATGIEEAKPPFAGSFRPTEPLSAFDGCDAYGPWTLRVYDAYYGDTGCLDCFAVIFTVSNVSPPDPSVLMAPAPAAGGLVLLGLLLIRRCPARSSAFTRSLAA